MKKRFSAIAAAFLSVSILMTGCSSDRPSGETEGTYDSGDHAQNPSDKISSESAEAKTEEAAEPRLEYPEIPDQKPTSDFTYAYNMDYNGIEITGYSGSDMRLRIPDTIEGENVTFINCEFPNTITQIEFPDTVTEITQLPESIKYFNIPAEYKAESTFQTPQLEMVKSHDEAFENEKNADIEINSVFFSRTVLAMPQSSTLYILDNFDSENLYTESLDGYWRREFVAAKILDGVTKIGTLTFDGCTSLTSINIPDGVTVIGDHAFSFCTSLTSINIPDSMTAICDYAFFGCTSLTSINIPDGVTVIGDGAFSGCTSLTSINIPDGVTAIGDFAFVDCTSLTSINIPDSMTAIGDYAFEGCTSLTSINIPDGVTKIGYSAFVGCTSLTSIDVSNKNTNYSSDDGILFSKDKTILISYPEGKTNVSYNVPDGVTEIGGSAFVDCTSLTSINIPDSVTEIRRFAFSGCTSLTSINIPDGVTAIGDFAFVDCTSLTSINIPDSVTAIGVDAFGGCPSLTNINYT